MEKENIELLDVSYDNAKSESNPRQIRTKKASFTSINDKFNAFRIRLLNKKLEEEKDKALKQEYVANADGEITAETEDKMLKNAKFIARLEEKIKVLSGENVPVDYVNRRAIKIKRAMMDNITSKSVVIYTVGKDSADKVFGQTSVESRENEVSLEEQKLVAEQLGRTMKSQVLPNDVDVKAAGYVPSLITREEIKFAVDEAFDEMNLKETVNEEVTEDTPSINLDDIKASIDEAFNEQEVYSEPEATIGPELIRDVVDEAIDSVNEEEKISLEDINVVIDDAMGQVVSKNGSSSAKLDRFNEDGTEKDRFNYVPMTDEEIKAAQANIEYDKYEQIYKMQNAQAYNFKTAEFKDIFKPANNNSKPVEDNNGPVIVSEVEETPNVISRPTSLEEFSELKAKVVELKKKLAESEKRKNNAVQFATRTASRAEEAKKVTIATEKEYQDRLASLQLLAQTLEENCNLNDTAARTAAMDAECNERFISTQMSKKNQYDEAINQVDSILGFSNDVEEVEHVRRVA